ncbi:CDP-diacylglycerol--glycerol-3-phosphate 3-phosphatidyltransferase [Flocculibacter collagenilyticus]|uniref:CDP-diacylglycerol--glycerol-3-phosphate 3-phosphatidyltransferase n=1 Tax=Flocculibacter collagenilyticus TaxID=2744479 RepID=UPI0018F59438|nr:CDP-diacylglycerol--glycerol-3-phosphate 3-phosphatidyltransferase [Flocculibacter collagenilyticus]
MWTIPNTLTLFRILLIPVFLIIFYLPYSWAHFGAAFVFWLAAITDALDGYLARKLEQSTPFGAFLDPVADKVMVVAACFIIAEDFQSAWITIPVLTMVAREVVISALREWMAELGKRASVAVSEMGKYKTAAQMLALIGLIWQPNDLVIWGIELGWLTDLAFLMLYIAFVLTLWSMVIYIKAAWSDLTYTKQEG